MQIDTRGMSWFKWSWLIHLWDYRTEKIDSETSNAATNMPKEESSIKGTYQVLQFVAKPYVAMQMTNIDPFTRLHDMKIESETSNAGTDMAKENILSTKHIDYSIFKHWYTWSKAPCHNANDNDNDWSIYETKKDRIWKRKVQLPIWSKEGM